MLLTRSILALLLVLLINASATAEEAPDESPSPRAAATTEDTRVSDSMEPGIGPTEMGEEVSPEELNEPAPSTNQASPIDESNSRLEILNYHRDLIRQSGETHLGATDRPLPCCQIHTAFQLLYPSSAIKLSFLVGFEFFVEDHFLLGVEGTTQLAADPNSYSYYGGLGTLRYFFGEGGDGLNILLGAGFGQFMGGAINSAATSNPTALNAKAALAYHWFLTGRLHIGLELGAQLFDYTVTESGLTPLKVMTIVPSGAFFLGSTF